jgi:hypothetical protein
MPRRFGGGGGGASVIFPMWVGLTPAVPAGAGALVGAGLAFDASNVIFAAGFVAPLADAPPEGFAAGLVEGFAPGLEPALLPGLDGTFEVALAAGLGPFAGFFDVPFLGAPFFLTTRRAPTTTTHG